jgi:hypothetical protein
MNAIQKLERPIYESAAWKFLAVLFAISLFKTGVWYFPSLSVSVAIAQNPFGPNPAASYLYGNWLGSFLAWTIGATSKLTFFLLHLAFSIAFSSLYARLAFTALPNEPARSSLILFFILPVSATSYFWVGPDSITLFLMLLALAYPQFAIVTVVAGILLGMQHFEQGIIAAAALTFCIFLGPVENRKIPYSLKFCLLWVPAIIAGKLILVGLFRFYSIQSAGRGVFLWQHLHTYLKQYFFHFHYIIWSALGAGWWIALRYADFGRHKIVFFVTLFSLLMVAPVVGDQTRVIAVITFPLIAAYWLFNEDFLAGFSRQEASIIFLAWAVIPWQWVWGGVPRWSVLPYDIAYLLHRLFGWIDIPVEPAEWPFIAWPG